MITKITRSKRPNTSVQFFREVFQAGQVPDTASIIADFETLYATGNATQDFSVSDDGLEETRTYTFADLNTFSAFETLNGIYIQNAFNVYRKTNNFGVYDYTDLSERQAAWSLTGIDQPYKVTTTYIFPEAHPEDFSQDSTQALFLNSLSEYEHYGKKIDIILDSNNVTVVHQYNNSADQTTNQYLDMFFIPQLAEHGVVRTIKYELV